MSGKIEGKKNFFWKTVLLSPAIGVQFTNKPIRNGKEGLKQNKTQLTMHEEAKYDWPKKHAINNMRPLLFSGYA